MSKFSVCFMSSKCSQTFPGLCTSSSSSSSSCNFSVIIASPVIVYFRLFYQCVIILVAGPQCTGGAASDFCTAANSVRLSPARPKNMRGTKHAWLTPPLLWIRKVGHQASARSASKNSGTGKGVVENRSSYASKNHFCKLPFTHIFIWNTS